MARINGEWPWPSTIQNRGIYPEEAKALATLEKNPLAQPIPELDAIRLIDAETHSEALRFQVDRIPGTADSEAFVPRFVYFRRVFEKATAPEALTFDKTIKEGVQIQGLPEERLKQMRSQLAREARMVAVVEKYRRSAERITAELLSKQSA